MATFTPISNDFIQYSAQASGTSAAGYFLKLYAAGTSTPISTALDSAGSPLVAKVELDSLGFAQNGSGGATTLYIDQTYRLVLYVNAADADANTFINAVQDIDDIPQLATLDGAGETVKSFATLAAAVADTNLLDGDSLNIAERTTGNGGGAMWDVVLSSTVTENTFNIVQCTGVPALSLVLRLENGVIYVDQFGAVGDFTTDSAGAIFQAWTTAERGSSVMYGHGTYRFGSGQDHPAKQLHHYGVGRTTGNVASAANVTVNGGTGLAFSSTTGTNRGGIYMGVPSGQNFSRFSSFNDMTFLGDGTTDSNGTNAGLKINNQGTMLHNVNFRYFQDCIEVNYAVAHEWLNVVAVGARYAVWHRYDTTTPFGAIENSVTTACGYRNITVHTSTTNTDAIGWYVDATCAYGSNHHGGAFNAESCYTAARFEGRIASKDAVSGSSTAFGAASWQGIGNTFDTAWFEANTGDNLNLSYDPGSNPPALSFRSLYQQTSGITAADSTGQNLLLQANSLSPLVEISTEGTVGNVGNWGAPFSGTQYLINGAEHNSPLSRTILQEKIGYRTANRATVDDKAGYEFSAVVPDIPVIASSLNVLNLNFGHTDMCATVEMTATGTDASGAHFTTVGKFLVTCSSTGAIASVIVDATFNGGTQMFFFQGIQVGGATSMVAGLFVWKNVNANVLNANIDFKVTMGGSGGGGYSSTVTPQL